MNTTSQTDANQRLIVALDFGSAQQALELVDRLRGRAVGSRSGWSCTTLPVESGGDLMQERLESIP